MYYRTTYIHVSLNFSFPKEKAGYNARPDALLPLSLFFFFRFTIVPECDPKELDFSPELSTLFYPKPYNIFAKPRS